jgi:hypothetical protein
MERFIARHQAVLTGTLSGYDRMLFKATLRGLSHVKGLLGFFGAKRVLLKDFGTFVQAQSARIKAHAEAVAQAAGRPCQYVPCSTASKEEIARQIAERDHITEGLICVLTCVEPCKSYALRRDRPTRQLQLVKTGRKCLFPDAADTPETRAHMAARTTRLLRLLRAHRLIQKVPRTTLYRVTPFGHKVMATALTCRQTPILELRHAA